MGFNYPYLSLIQMLLSLTENKRGLDNCNIKKCVQFFQSP